INICWVCAAFDMNQSPFLGRQEARHKKQTLVAFELRSGCLIILIATRPFRWDKIGLNALKKAAP
ncbi:MAG: hypothetical protein ACXVCK_06380, partial [Bdellovibrionota bacterium]